MGNIVQLESYKISYSSIIYFLVANLKLNFLCPSQRHGRYGKRRVLVDGRKEVDKERYFSRYEELVGSANPQDFQTYYDDIYESVVKRFKNKPVTIHRMTTTEWFKNFKEKLDWIYVDARHDTPGVYEDLINSVKVLKKGGVIYGDDYGFNKYCVKVAVDKFIEKTGLTLNNFYQDQYEIIT